MNLRRLVNDSIVITQRNLTKIVRVPEILTFVFMSPVMLVLLFAYVFGGAIDPGGGVNYREFVIGGIFAQTVVFGATFTGAGIAEDMTKGIIDRFRSLPMAPAAVLIGRTGSDVVINVLSLIVMFLTGLVVGWRAREGLGKALLAFVLLLAFAYAISWVMAYVGLMVPSVEVINNASFVVIMPLTFISNAFVPLESFPRVLQYFVEWNPVSALTQAVRELFGNTNEALAVSSVWSMQHPMAYTVLWIILILAVFVPVSVRKYRATSRHA